MIIAKAAAAAMMMFLLSSAATLTDDPEAVVKLFLRAVQLNDAQKLSEMVFPRTAVSLLLGSEPATKARIDEVETEMRALKLRQLSPFGDRA
jgi:hypothetical protein